MDEPMGGDRRSATFLVFGKISGVIPGREKNFYCKV
jgi:hypothetical protein